MLDVGVLYHYSPRLIRVAGWPLSRALPCHINAKAHRASGRELLRPRSCSRLCCSHRCRSSSASVTFCLQLASATPTSSSSSHWPRTRRRTSLWTTPTRRTSCTCGGTTCWEARGQGWRHRPSTDDQAYPDGWVSAARASLRVTARRSGARPCSRVTTRRMGLARWISCRSTDRRCALTRSAHA